MLDESSSESSDGTEGNFLQVDDLIREGWLLSLPRDDPDGADWQWWYVSCGVCEMVYHVFLHQEGDRVVAMMAPLMNTRRKNKRTTCEQATAQSSEKAYARAHRCTNKRTTD